MRCSFFVVWLGLAISSLAGSPRPAEAATIEGRVVDSAGKPVRGAEVRIWQKPSGRGGRFADRPVEFEGSDALLTDAEGRFVSPDVVVAGAMAQIVAEAGGMLAGRTGLFPIAKDAVDGATVFNSGDGHERVEAKSKGGGKFLLSDVPKGGVFLFAEKPGYRFTGMRLPADQAEATLVLTSLDEPAEPKAALPPLVSLPDRWNGRHEYAAGFWAPSAKDRPLPP